MPSGGAPTGDHDPAWLKEDGRKQPLLPPEAKDAPSSSVDEEAGGRGSSSVKAPKKGGRGQQGRRRGKRMVRPFFAILGTITALAALAVVAVNLYVLVADGQEEKETEDSVDRAVLRGFGVALGFVALLTELRLKWWKRLCPVLDYLWVRGAFYGLVAFLTITDFTHWTEANNVVGVIFLCLSGLYLCAGLLCIRRHVEVEG